MSLSPSQKDKVYIYAGPGASQVALDHTNHSLRQFLHPRYQIQTLTPKEIAEGQWAHEAVLFIMPGGADIFYARSLRGQGNQQIHNYVHNGGRYLGICAGAYYGGKHLHWAVGSPQEIIAERNLAFYPDIIEGPTLKPWDHKTNSGADIASLYWKDTHEIFPTKYPLSIYYNGGGHFVNASNHKNVTILADYATTLPQKPAIVEISVNKGQAILSSVHCEFSPHIMDLSDPYITPLVQQLMTTDHDRGTLMTHLLNRLNIETITLKPIEHRKG
jgi:biotin--protein ligase